MYKHYDLEYFHYMWRADDLSTRQAYAKKTS